MKKRLITWLGIALSGALLYWIATKFDLAEVADQLGRAKIGWAVAGSAVYAVLFGFRGLRWAVLLRPVKRISGWSASEVYTIGFMANNVLPARLGDVARAYVLARKEKIPAAASFSSVMLERIIDGVTVVAFLGLVLIIEPPEAEWVWELSLVAACAFFGAIAVCALVAWDQRWVTAVAGRMLFFASDALRDRVYGLIDRLATGLHALRSVGRTAEVAVLSLFVWSLETSVYVLAARAFSIDLSTMATVMVMATLTLGLTIPSAPGFVGVFERLIVEAVALYGITGPTALAFAVTVHIIHFVPGTLLGLVFSWKSGLRLNEIRHAAEPSSEPTAEGDAGVEMASDPFVAPIQETESKG